MKAKNSIYDRLPVQPLGTIVDRAITDKTLVAELNANSGCNIQVENHDEILIADVKSVDVSDHLVLENGEVEQPRSSGRKRSKPIVAMIKLI